MISQVSFKAGIRFLAFENIKTSMNTLDKNGSMTTTINLFAGLGAGLIEVLIKINLNNY